MKINDKIGYVTGAIMLCLFVPVFLYAQVSPVNLGTSVATAPAITDTVTAAVADGAENYFKIETEHLPATVYYFPDTAFGPVPALVNFAEDDTIEAVIVSENCRMGWRWNLEQAGGEGTRYFFFSAHEDNATAEIMPYIHTCIPYDITLPEVKVCDEYVWGDTTILDSRTYTRRFKTKQGCDSVVTQKVTVLKSGTETDIVTAYDSYTWRDGKTYTSSVMGPKWEETNGSECSMFFTLDLTIRHLKKDTIRPAVCPAELPYVWRDQSYSESVMVSTDTLLSTTSDVDTIHTLSLTVNKAYAVDTVAKVCGTSFMWRGQNYAQSGNYPFAGVTKAGCDSTVTLHLTLGATTTGEETREAEGSYTWNGVTYSESGDYIYHTTNAAGCDSTAVLHLTIISNYQYETVYFCPGQNTEHEEIVAPGLKRRYVTYSYESPAGWDYMEGAILSREHDRMQVNLHRAEQNLREHYVGNLTPVKSITWSYLPYGESDYRPLELENGAQWIPTGTVAVAVRFVCGQLYTSDFVTDVKMVGGENATGEKVLVNGQIMIIRNGKKYNILGSIIE